MYQWKEHEIIPCASVGFGNLCFILSQGALPRLLVGGGAAADHSCQSGGPFERTILYCFHVSLRQP